MISFIIVNSNNKDLTYQTIQQISRTVTEAPFEVILLDSQSVDGSREIFSQLSRDVSWLHYEILPKRTTLSQASNRGAKLALGEILVFISSGYILNSLGLDRILHFEMTEKVGILSIGDRSSQKDIFWSLFNLMFYGNLKNHISKSFLAIRRQDFIDLKGFDEQFSYRLHDVDISLRMKILKQKETHISQSIMGETRVNIQLREELGYLSQEKLESLKSYIYFLSKNKTQTHAKILSALYMAYLEITALFYLLTIRYDKYVNRSKSVQVLSQFLLSKQET